jgi:hypothetical protein
VRREAANRVTIYCRAETVRRRGGTERGTLRAGRVRVCGAVGHPRVPWLRRLQLFQVRPGRCAHWRLEGPLLSRFGRFRSLGGGARGLTPMGCVRTHSLQRHTADGDGTVRYPGGAHQPGGGEDAHLVRSAPRHGRDPTAHELTRGPGGGWHTATNKLRIVTVGISGGVSLTRLFRDARRFPSTRWYPVPRATRTTRVFGICPWFKGHFLSRRAKPWRYDLHLLRRWVAADREQGNIG